MKPLIRFGRRIPVPSTLQIKHELRTFSMEKFWAEVCPEEVRQAAPEVGSTIAVDTRTG